uniref:putative methyltransferase NSUN7 isoform X2 n=1 Tax=Scatophagus argus TaxID=75038 RepID=UPI001ED7CC67|nr:putative methyltransferase NSUN7 isoform X2 [Scatophagus argus]
MQSPNASKVTETLGEKAGHSSHKMSEGKHISKKMITNKKVGGWPSCSSKCKTGKAGSQIPSGKDATHLYDPSSGDVPATSTDLQTTSQSQQGFPDKVFLLASVIFQNNHLEKPANHQLVNYGKKRGLPIPEVKDEEMQRKAYELAFSTLTYQELLEDIMMDSRLYLTQPMPDDQMSLVAVMLYDFQDRKFLPWEHLGKEEIIEEVEEVENYLLKFKTRLAASLARCRIKHDLLSISCILPESVKVKQKRSSSLPLYAWVNALKSSLDEVQGGLKSAGFSQVKSIGQLEGQTFCQDPHCGDILVFPAQLKAQLHSTKLLSDHKLIIQDKSCCLGPYAVCALLPEEGDVLIVGCFSARTVSHTASLIAEKQRANCNGQPTVYVCVSNCTDTQREELQQAVTAMGCKNVKLIQEDFLSLYGGDKRLRKVRVILLTPKCSVSAVSNPVEFILRENGDTDLLQDLSRGSIAQSKLETLVTQQRKDIDHALKFPGVSAVVYSTCSSYREENEEVVSRALKQAKAHSDQEGKPREAANFSLSQWLKRHHKKCSSGQMPKAYWTGSATSNQPEKRSVVMPAGRQKQPMLAPLSPSSLSVFSPKAPRSRAATVLLRVDIRNFPTGGSHQKERPKLCACKPQRTLHPIPSLPQNKKAPALPPPPLLLNQKT